VELTRTPGFMGGTQGERKSRRKEEAEGRKESVELTRTPRFMGWTRAETENKRKGRRGRKE
jgi:hypothetical protein